MEQFLKNKAEVWILIRDNNKLLIASIELQMVSNSNSNEAKLAAVVQAVNFAIEIGVRNIILGGDLAYVIDKL